MKKQKLYGTTRVVITKRCYGPPPTGGTALLPAATEIACNIEVNGKRVYLARQPRAHYMESEPGLFEQWLVTGCRLFKEGERRQDGRADRGDLSGCFKLAWRRFIRFASAK